MPPKKKAKTTHSTSVSSSSKTPATAKGGTATRGRNVRGRRGGLQDMPKMPLDILFEIFGFLHPRDLLNLARTTKEFRAFLMSRDAAHFWEKARKQVRDIPDKPAHLSEPAYANLLFFTHCHNCLKGGAHVTAYWEVAARYCASCRTEVFTTNCDEVFKPIWLEFNVESSEVVVRVYIRSERMRGAWYLKAELAKIERDWKSLANKTQKTRYIRDRKKFVKQCAELSTQLERWQDGLKKRAAAESDSVRETRYEAVLTKLRQEGWGEELNRMDKSSLNGLSHLNGVSRATKLTEQGWATIRGSVIDYVQQFKSRRLSKERADLLRNRLWILKQAVHKLQHAKWPADCKDRLYVGLADCAYMPEVRAIIEDTSSGVTKQSVKLELKKVLPGLIDGWVEERRSELVAFLRTQVGEDSAAARVPEPLQLAIASFRCLSCRTDQLRWPHIAEHRCGYMRTAINDLYDQCLNNLPQRVIADTRLPGKYIDMHCRIEHTRDIITLCGADPDTVTYDEMEACAVRLACRRCATYATQDIFDWKGAITHGSEKHWKSKPLAGRWMVVTEENAAKARALESALEATPLNLEPTGYVPNPDNYHCGWCGYIGRVSEMYNHLQQNHAKPKAESKLDQDFYLLKRYKPNIWMLSDVFSECESEKNTVAAGKGFFASL
ncbi:hypothetical protein C8T65DRAFT_830619 [Cerioporus squamosus]|nr:hypothetical protein C8T65DRAFT_830619 [Cerioporus squamosus]